MDVAARGSTLLDLFVIVAIVVILAATLFPVFSLLSTVQHLGSTAIAPAPVGHTGCDGQYAANSEAQRAGLLGCAAVACTAVMIGILIEGGHRS
jgi:hypothetical protein